MCKRINICLLILAMCALLLPPELHARATKTYFTGMEYQTDIIEPGTWLTDGESLFGIGKTSQTLEDLSDPRASGAGTVAGNGIMSLEDGSMSMWGDFLIENADGAWTGKWVGVADSSGMWIVATLVGSGDYEGLVMYWHGTAGMAGIEVEGYIVEDDRGPGDRPYQVMQTRVDRAEIIPCYVLDPETMSPTGEYAAIGRVDILEGESRSSHAGTCIPSGIGLVNPFTSELTAMGAETSPSGEIIYWVGNGTSILNPEDGTIVFEGCIRFAGGTGRFEAVTGGFEAYIEESMEMVSEDPMIVLSFLDYRARGTIRY